MKGRSKFGILAFRFVMSCGRGPLETEATGGSFKVPLTPTHLHQPTLACACMFVCMKLDLQKGFIAGTDDFKWAARVSQEIVS